jgi:hypothetical protein
MPPKRTIKMPKFRFDERLRLPENVQDAVELARIEANREFGDATSDAAAISDRKERELSGEWVLRIVLGFIQAACEEIRHRRRNLAQVVRWRDELFDALCEGYEVFSREVQDELRRSAQWRKGESLLANAAKGTTEHSDGWILFQRGRATSPRITGSRCPQLAKSRQTQGP